MKSPGHQVNATIKQPDCLLQYVAYAAVRAAAQNRQLFVIHYCKKKLVMKLINNFSFPGPFGIKIIKAGIFFKNYRNMRDYKNSFINFGDIICKLKPVFKFRRNGWSSDIIPAAVVCVLRLLF